MKFCLHIYFDIFTFYFFSNIEKMNIEKRNISKNIKYYTTILFFYIQKVYTYVYFLYA